jgi:uncharacterized phage protein (TIGR01671 family)
VIHTREILFRGKRLDNGKWVQGFYWTNELGNHFIRVTKDTETGMFVIEDYEVDPSTVGQYTGLKDKNRKMIFKGDILKTNRWKTFDEKRYVGYNGGSFVYTNIPLLNQNHNTFSVYDSTNELKQWEIIGNTTDNPELIP